MTTLAPSLTRSLDRLERLVWESQDRRLRAAGFEVTRIGRWRRSYRRPFRTVPLAEPEPTEPARPTLLSRPGRGTRSADLLQPAALVRSAP